MTSQAAWRECLVQTLDVHKTLDAQSSSDVEQFCQKVEFQLSCILHVPSLDGVTGRENDAMGHPL